MTAFDDLFPSTRGLYFRLSQLCLLERVMNNTFAMYVCRCLDELRVRGINRTIARKRGYLVRIRNYEELEG